MIRSIFLKRAMLFFAILLYGSVLTAQNIGIGTGKPAASAILELSSTKQGFLPPRLTLAQRDSLKSPEIGLMIYCTTCDEIQVYTQASWKRTDGTRACNFTGLGVTICDQVWMNKNLNVSTYRNGDTIPQVTDAAVWSTLTTGAWCWYNNDSATYGAVYGKLYNWYAVNDPRGLAPLGWHVPSLIEFNNLITCLGAKDSTGGYLKEQDTIHWKSPNTGATNSSGFTALPGGYRRAAGTFNLQGFEARFWLSSVSAGKNAYYFSLLNSMPGFDNRDFLQLSGFSVRCVRD